MINCCFRIRPILTCVLICLAASASVFAQNSTGTGLTVIYFDDQDLSGDHLVSQSPSINFNWGRGSPISQIDDDTFSAIWFGWIEPLYSETYTFYTETDDGVRLVINDRQIIDEWGDGAARERTGTIALLAGQLYPIRLFYYENRGDASVTLSWSSESQRKQVIPGSQLYPGDPAIFITDRPTWTPTLSPTPSDTPTPTSTPSNTPTSTDTSTPTATFTPSITPSQTPTHTPTLTFTPSLTPTPTPIPYQISATSSINARDCPELNCEIVNMIAPGELILVKDIVEGAVVSGSSDWLFGTYNGEEVYIHISLAQRFVPPTPTRRVDTSQTTTYYVNSTSRVNIRSCASTSCEVIGGADRGDQLQVIDAEGEWQRVLLPGNRIGYIATSLTSRNQPPTLVPRPTQRPMPVQPAQPSGSQQSQPVSTVPPAPAGPQFTCSCSKTCDQMASCDEAYFQLRQCGCSRRDGDGDGVPCESICPGG